jgi:signal transduction histidine kinase/CheY-like chemotaxis protein
MASGTQRTDQDAAGSDALLTEILDFSPTAVAISAVADTTLLYVNPAMAAYFGTTKQAALAMPALSFVEPADQTKVREALAARGEIRRFPVRSRMPEGRVSLFSCKLITFRGTPAVLSWLEDRTEQVRREKEILSTAKQIELLHHIAGICNRALNFFDALRKASAEIARALDWPMGLVYRLAHGDDQLVELSSLSLPKDQPAFEQMRGYLMGRAFRSGEDLPGRVLREKQIVWIEDAAGDAGLPRFAGEEPVKVASALGIPIVADGKVVAVVELLSDKPAPRDDILMLTLAQVSSELGRVHLRDLTTVALQGARAEAESNAKAKANFLAAMSHEVRTPMNGVIGMVDLILQTRLDEEQRFMLQTVKDSGQALIKVINDILDFSKIEAGRLEIEQAPFSLLKVVEDVALSLAPAAAKKGLKLVSFVSPDLPDVVMGDAVRVRQILSNLGSNAIKFSERGEILIKAAAAEKEGAGITVQFSVRDEGVGISAEARTRLFEEFQQADSSTTRRFGGTGLGLAICHRLTALMGGSIGVESLLGVGSEFRCVLPFAASDTGTAHGTADLAGVRVLVVAESEALREACRSYLAYWKADVVAVPRLRDAAALIRDGGRAEAPRRLDVIVLPEAADGREIAAVRDAAADAGLVAPRIVVNRVATTGSFIRELTIIDVNPLRRAPLVAAVAVAAGRASPETTAIQTSEQIETQIAPTVEEARAQGRLILVAEDHVANQDVIVRQLNRLGYACELAEDGEIALTRWRTGRYALVLTDCHMPNMDGFQLTAEIRKAEDGRPGRTPIVAITANVLQGEAERCLAAGMDAFLAKPVELRSLRDTLSRWLVPGRAPAPIATPDNGTPIDPQILDLTRMREAFGQIDDGARAFFELFIASVSPLIDQFHNEIAGARHAQARELIHKARGASANAGATELAALMARIETALVEQRVAEAATVARDIGPAWERLAQAIAQV